jgi:putative transposase
MPRRKQPLIPDELLDQLLAGSDARSALADGGLLDGLKKALAERALNAELDHHLEGGEPDGRANGRNGYGAKSVLTGTGRLELQVPRDRLATFDPQLIAKYQRRFPGFDDKIVSMYARGMSTREIGGHLRELYGIEVSPDLVSAVTDAVLEEVAEWQNRPLEALYPLVFLDAPAREGARRGHGPQQGRLCGPRRSPPMAPRRSSGSGSSRPRAPSSGCAS